MKDKTEIITRALSRFPLFKDIPEESLRELAGSTGIERSEHNKEIFGTKDTGKIYIVASGKVELTISGETEGGEAREIYGEMSLLDGTHPHTRAVASGDCVLLVLKRDEFIDFLKKNREAAFMLLEKLNLDLNYREERGEEEEPGRETQGEEETEEGPAEDQEEWLYERNYKCPFCHREFSTMMPRSKHVQVRKTDYDMCTHYRKVNPTHYYVIVCSHCGFAFPQDERSSPPQSAVQEIENYLSGLQQMDNFGGTRDIDLAIKSYSLGIACQKLKKASYAIIGRLYLRQGCLYRQKGLPEEETACLQQAREYLENAYLYEDISDPRGELNLLYLVGELYGRQGNVAEAVQWFSRIINHEYANSYRYLVNRARDRWQELKRES